MELQYINYEEGETPTLYLHKNIGQNRFQPKGIDGFDIIKEINYIESLPNVTDLTVSINNGGGVIKDGWSIISKLMNTKLNTTGIIEGQAYSISFLIALACKNLKMYDYSMMMTHGASTSERKSKKVNGVIDKYNASLVTFISNRTNLDQKVISDMMKEETYLDPTEALKLGIIDEIIPSNVDEYFVNHLQVIYDCMNTSEDKSETTEIIKKIYINKDKDDLLNHLDMIYNSLTKNNHKIMKEDVKNTETVETEEVVKNVITNDFESKFNELLKENNELKLKVELFEKKENETIENNIHSVLESVKDDLSEEDYDKWFNIGKTDLDFVKTNVEKLTTKTPIQTIEAKKIIKKTNEDNSQYLDLRKMEKEDSAGLQAIMDNDPELYARSFEKVYGVEYTS